MTLPVIPGNPDLIISYQQIGAQPISLLCPHCRQIGIFETLGVNDILSLGSSNRYYGQRRCPNTECRGHIFVILAPGNILIHAHPRITIPFDNSKIPDRIVNALKEAITCHSTECYTASAIMIRKTLEELAEEKGVEGSNLKHKIQKLGTTIVMPQELIQAMDELRLLGNDAAHIEAKTYEQIGREEIEISIEFTKEILKATYQYDDLLSRLRSLKQQPTQ